MRKRDPDLNRILLIDADVLVYAYCHAHQKVVEWSEELHTIQANPAAAKAELVRFVDRMQEELDASQVIYALSDLKKNFRKAVLPKYKAHRAGVVQPVLFRTLRAFLREEHAAVQRPGLEGDDVLSMLMDYYQDWDGQNPIACTIDKDLLTVPGLHYNWQKPGQGVVYVGPEEAERNFLHQVLTGDPTDGYPGCPGIGKVRAGRILDADCSWDAVVAAYEKSGQTVDDALTNARCARLLRFGDYDTKTGEVKLWEPTPLVGSSTDDGESSSIESTLNSSGKEQKK